MSTWADFNPPSVEEASIDLEVIENIRLSGLEVTTLARICKYPKHGVSREKVYFDCHGREFIDLLIREF